jgi:HEAT repeat protein
VPSDLNPGVRKAAEVPAELPWSEPVAGLRGRIEYFDVGYYGVEIIVRLQNISNGSVTVPVNRWGNPIDASTFAVVVRTPGGRFKPMDWINDSEAGVDVNTSGPPVVLRPGESTLACLHGANEQFESLPSELKVRVASHGTLETPSHLADANRLLPHGPRGLPMPEHFPELASSEADPETVEALPTFPQGENYDLIQALDMYDPSAVRTEFERRLRSPHRSDDRLLLAAIAACRGSSRGRQALLDGLKATDWIDAWNVDSAMMLATESYPKSRPLPEWLAQMMISALSDQRQRTDVHRTNIPDPSVHTLADIADEDADLPYALGEFRCRQAVPLLIDRVNRWQSVDAIQALGEIGDPRAVPCVLETLRNSRKLATDPSDVITTALVDHAVIAAGKLKIREALPTLLPLLYESNVVEAVEAIGDPAAIPALKRIVDTGKSAHPPGVKACPDNVMVSYARIALATLRPGDPIPRYCEILADRSTEESARIAVINRMAAHPDPRTIPSLIAAIKSDPSGQVVDAAISTLSGMKYRLAVIGLIACLDCDFDHRTWPIDSDRLTCRSLIVGALQSLTGQRFGSNKGQWTWWMNTSGPNPRDSQ